MSGVRKTAVVICPGRGTYGKDELGYLARHFPDADMLAQFDALRAARGEESLRELDGAARYSLARHSRGDTASALIYAASLGDFIALDQGAVEVVAVTGNSMGWYSACALAGALSPQGGFEVVNTMGALMQDAMIGGQLVYPVTGKDWRPDPARQQELRRVIQEIDAQSGHDLGLSIDLGGMWVLAGNEAGLRAFDATVPRVQDRYPMRLPNHAGFHTPMQGPVAETGRRALAASLFAQPDLPLIDGRGAIWWPGAVNSDELWDYTLGHQITQPYDFATAIRVAAREFAPDMFVITGPGTTLGGSVAQSLIAANWQSMGDKTEFEHQQKTNPILIAMGRDDQRGHVTKGLKN